MAEIIPAILPKSYTELEEKLELIAAHAPVVQIDICDGGYTSSRTWPYLKGDHDDIFQDIIDQNRALPHWEEANLEFDLMTKDAYSKIPDFISAGASRIVVHKASLSDQELQDIFADFGKKSEELGPFDIELGVALDSTANAQDIAGFVDHVHFIQVMGIAKVGHQGQPFDTRALTLVSSLRSAYPNLTISVDGGVNLDTAKGLIDAGANRLVVGSALFASHNILETLEDFKALS
jgi:ribulose-phosphate 3-epimerase